MSQTSLTCFQQRRAALFDLLPENAVALIASGEEQIRNRDVEHAFRAHSDFSYLTGFEEPESLLMLRKTAKNNQVWLFLRPKDPHMETWGGRRLGVEKAPETLKVDAAYAIEDLDEQANEFLENIDNVYFSFDELADWSGNLAEWISGLKQKVRKGITAPKSLNDLDALLHEMRMIKSADEIELIRKAAQISVQGHLAAMQAGKPLAYEYQVQSAVEHTFRMASSPRVAFGTIAAAGNNACILHYTENQAQIQDGDLILVDAGAEYGGYAGDITTTFPANGVFSEPQKQLYGLVLKAQQAAIEQVKAGNRYDSMHLAATRVITEGLLELGILQGELETLLEEQACKDYFMHNTGHWLGRDVHDVGRYKIDGQWRDFEVGMLVTVEPGIYVAEDADVEQKWRGIGIRIEDDVLVTEQGNEVLTLGLPRTPEEIENYMREYRD